MPDGNATCFTCQILMHTTIFFCYSKTLEIYTKRVLVLWISKKVFNENIRIMSEILKGVGRHTLYDIKEFFAPLTKSISYNADHIKRYVKVENFFWYYINDLVNQFYFVCSMPKHDTLILNSVLFHPVKFKLFQISNY